MQNTPVLWSTRLLAACTDANKTALHLASGLNIDDYPGLMIKNFSQKVIFPARYLL